MAAVGAPAGNNNAGKGKAWQNALQRAIVRRPKDLDGIADVLFDAALSGDISAIKELADRLDGKSVATVQGPGDNGEFRSVQRIEQSIVDPADTGTA